MSILSLPAIGRLAERHVRQHGQPIPRAALVKFLRSIDVDVPDDRADAGVRLAITVGRLAATPNGIAILALDEGMAAA